jgi:PHP family Zn ribbon phosphoesterase
MIPPLIVQEALAHGIQIIAITDHNATGNVYAVQKAAEGTGLTVLPGMELQTKEEVHLLCLFQNNYDMESWQSIIDTRLPNIDNLVDYFGEQFIVDETGDFLGREKRLLLTSADISIDEAILTIDALGGLAIPAHVDRKSFGLFANLGMFPVGVPIEAVEISRHLDPAAASSKYPQLEGRTLVQGGDVHRLEEFLGVNEFSIEQPTLDEIRLAFTNQGGRKLHLLTFNC